ncbi:MAG: hypothetical protein U1G07_15180 [Verrucomicrobiota bacterium]
MPSNTCRLRSNWRERQGANAVPRRLFPSASWSWLICCLASLWGVGRVWLALAADAGPQLTTFQLQGPRQLSLSWTGSAPAYQVQVRDKLDAGSWQPLLTSSHTAALVGLESSAGFFRVVALASGLVGSISDERRLAVLDAIRESIATLPGDDPAVESRQLAEFVAGFEEIQVAGVDRDTSVWARFVDGRPLLIVNNRRPARDDELERSPAATVSQAGLLTESGPQTKADLVPERGLASVLQSPGQPTPTGIPASARAVLFQATLPGIKAPMLASLVPAFQSRGYEVSGGEASLPNFLAVETVGNDIGVLYIDSHGGLLPVQLEVTNAVTQVVQTYAFRIFVVATSTVVDAASERIYRPYFERGEVGYTLCGPSVLKGLSRDATIVERRSIYFITPAFARHHWTFGPNSFVYIDTCHSGSDVATDFAEVCFDRGAAAYAGWTDSVHDAWAFNKVTRRLFDGLIGGSPIYPQTPKQRPFDRVALRSYLRRQGLDKDQTPGFPGAELTFLSRPNSAAQFGLLAPSIQSMSTDEIKGELRLVGLFDLTAPAQVRVEGQSSQDVDVTPIRIEGAASQPAPTQIICPLPADRQPSAGMVTVIQRGRRSNTVPLTEWRVQGRLERSFVSGLTQPSAFYDFKVHLRTDLHEYRRIPYETPIFPGNYAQIGRDSTCRLSQAAGIYHDPNQIRTVEWLLNAPADPPLLYMPPLEQDSTWFNGATTFLADRSIYFVVSARVKDSVTVVEKTISSITGEPIEFRQLFNPIVRTFSGSGRNGTVDRTSFAIPAGQGTVAGDAGLIRWETAQASFAPAPADPETEE